MTTEDIAILTLADRDRWTAEHEQDGLPSQSWNFAWGLRPSGVDPKLAIVRAAGARMLLPFFERTWMNTKDIATIAGISGTSILPNSPAPLLLWHEYAKTQEWIAGYLRLSITVNVEGFFVAERIATNDCVVLLSLREQPRLRSLSHGIRSNIQKAARDHAALVDDRVLLTKALKRLYPETMKRADAAAEFHYPSETLERWASDPSSELLGASVGGSIELVHLFLVAGQHAESHILGCTERGRELNAWLLWNALEHLRDRGATVLNLTGGVKPGDGIYRFKMGFGGVPVPKMSVQQIYDRPRYDELCAQAGVSEKTAWFPAYRERR